jgi:hypothetical protein
LPVPLAAERRADERAALEVQDRRRPSQADDGEIALDAFDAIDARAMLDDPENDRLAA